MAYEKATEVKPANGVIVINAAPNTPTTAFYRDVDDKSGQLTPLAAFSPNDFGPCKLGNPGCYCWFFRIGGQEFEVPFFCPPE